MLGLKLIHVSKRGHWGKIIVKQELVLPLVVVVVVVVVVVAAVVAAVAVAVDIHKRLAGDYQSSLDALLKLF